jgi:hypothetical protein
LLRKSGFIKMLDEIPIPIPKTQMPEKKEQNILLTTNGSKISSVVLIGIKEEDHSVDFSDEKEG